MVRKNDEIGESDEHNARGIELADRGWLDEAASEFHKAIELDPEATHARDNLATIFVEKGQYLDALSEFLEAVKREPESPSARHYLGSFLAAHGTELAIEQFRHALELEYDFADAHLNLALALAERGEFDEAVSELEIAHGQAPDDEMIQHELASCLIDLERYPEAIGHLKRIVREHPEHIEAFVDLGVAYTAQGFFAEAESTLTQALKIDAEDFATLYYLAGLYASWERTDESIEFLEKLAILDREKFQDWAQEDPLFMSLEQNTRFLQLLDED